MARKGRAKARAKRNYRSSPLSKFVRGIISGQEYFKLTKQNFK